MAKPHELASVRLLAGLSEAQLDAIAAIGEYRVYEAGRTVFVEGDEGTHVFCVLNGRVELTIALGDKTQQVPVHVSTPGSVFGEFALFEDHIRSATARAALPASIFAVKAELLLQAFAKDPAMGYAAMRNLCRIMVDRMKKTTQELRASLMW